ncbi:hypothetical protein Bbelb_332230 [Branchiostoma belcheri]|nr:hypothetical protein Bbelb_332230 [Branchiostoma belcheri]
MPRAGSKDGCAIQARERLFVFVHPAPDIGQTSAETQTTRGAGNTCPGHGVPLKLPSLRQSGAHFSLHQAPRIAGKIVEIVRNEKIVYQRRSRAIEDPVRDPHFGDLY